MKAFADYYRGEPAIQEIKWRLYPTVRTAWAAMMRGEIDFLYEVGHDAEEFIEAEASVQVFRFLRNYVYGMVFNSKRVVFADGQIRRALNYAVNRTEIVNQAFKGHGTTADVPAWPLHWAYDSTTPKFSYDPARAVALLDAAGTELPTNNRIVGKNAPARIRFTCLLPERFALWERMALLVQRNLSEVGVDMRLEAVPFAQFNERIGSGDFDAVMIELIVGNNASRPYFFWQSESKRNAWGYRDPHIDTALEGLRRAVGDGKYRDAFRLFQAGMVEEPPAVFLAFGETSRAVSRRFQVVAPAGSDIVPTIGEWKLAEHSRLAN